MLQMWVQPAEFTPVVNASLLLGSPYNLRDRE